MITARYFYYSCILVLLVNTSVLVPNILLNDRNQGALLAMAISILSGPALAFAFVSAFKKIPGMDLPELLRQRLASWIRLPLLIFLSIMWYISGGLVLMNFAVITKRFINPELQKYVILTLFLIAVIYGATRSTKTVLYAMELILVINTPFTAFILFKALHDPNLSWDAIKTMLTYWRQPPSLRSVAAATYLFSGYFNWAIFNRESVRFNPKLIWLFPLLGASVLFTSVAIPLGFQGTQAVDDYVYPWIATSDTMLLRYGVIERVLFVYLLLYLGISILFGVVTWHVGTELLTSFLLPKQPAMSKFGRMYAHYLPWGLALAAGGVFYFLERLLDEKQLFVMSQTWLTMRFFSEFGLVGLIWLLVRRTVKKS